MSPQAARLEDGPFGWTPPGEWVQNAACAGHDTNTFFLDRGDARQLKRVTAISICATCEVEMDCLLYALSIPGLKGIWGGETENGRRIIRSRMRTARKEAA